MFPLVNLCLIIVSLRKPLSWLHISVFGFPGPPFCIFSRGSQGCLWQGGSAGHGESQVVFGPWLWRRNCLKLGQDPAKSDRRKGLAIFSPQPTVAAGGTYTRQKLQRRGKPLPVQAIAVLSDCDRTNWLLLELKGQGEVFVIPGSVWLTMQQLMSPTEGH